MWSILIMTLPTQPNAVRLRVWRAIKNLGCVALRDGAYVLPAENTRAFDELAAEVRAHGGGAVVMSLSPRDSAQQREVLQRFDRSALYAEWHAALEALRAKLNKLREVEARRRVRAVADDLQNLLRIDYYPGRAAEQARSELSHLQQALETRYASGEPHAAKRKARGLTSLDARRFQGKRWATRARPWVDRLASAWLIRRFVDPRAEFIWFEPAKKTPRSAIGFDYDGAQFTHVGNLVTFEVIAASFGLDADPKIKRIAAIVRYLDVGGIPAAEAPGLEAVLAGLREVHADDDKLNRAAHAVFDAMYATPAAKLSS